MAKPITLTKKKPEGLFEEIMAFAGQYVKFHEDLIPAPLCSIGAHIANLKQQQKPFFYVDGIPEDIRLSITYVAPSGLSKSFPMKFFVHKWWGICPLKCAFRGKITEAGFVGTIKDGDEIRGDAWHFKDGIVAFNEISNIFMTAQQEHSTELINQVMESLSEGKVSKKLGTGTIEYETGVTIWGATQPKRFDFSQGLARRFLFVSRTWTQKDLDELKRSRRTKNSTNGGIRKEIDVDEAKSLKDKLNRIVVGFKAEDIDWDPKMQDFIEEITSTHLEETTLEHALLGKVVLEQPTDKTIEVKCTAENKDLIKRFCGMQNMVAEGSDVSLMVSVLQELGGTTTKSDIWDRFRKFSYTLENFSNLLEQCMRLGVVIKTFGKDGGPTKYILRRGLR
jgi:hypothetical protein